MSKAKPSLPPRVLEWERVKHLLAGQVKSRTDPDTSYGVRIILDADVLCACKQSIIRGKVCPHIPTLVDSLNEAELRQWLRDAFHVGTPQDREE